MIYNYLKLPFVKAKESTSAFLLSSNPAKIKKNIHVKNDIKKYWDILDICDAIYRT